MRRHDFPILNGAHSLNRGKPLVYLDSATSAQKPQQVIQAMHDFYRQDYANIHRGIYELSERATYQYEAARLAVKNLLHAASVNEIIFVSGTTEAINCVSQSFARATFKAGDEILLSGMEHHSNIVPWYLLKEQMGVELKVIPVLDNGELDLAAFERLLSPRTRLIAVTHVSNVLGTINPIKTITRLAHAQNIPVLVDGAQAVPHLPVDVSDLDCDFYTFSSHKLYGPTGIGVLYAKERWHDQMQPYQGGGDMIETVRLTHDFSHVTYAKAPQKFEAGTPHLAGAIGLHAAIDYLAAIGMDNIHAHNQALLNQTMSALNDLPYVRIFGNAPQKVGVLSFVLDDIHPHDVGTVLDHEGIAVRAGHHCAMPLMERFNVPAMVRASFGLYNNEKDIAALVDGIQLAKKIFG